MKISLACDHGGLSLKLAVKQHLEALGHQVEDFGTHTRDSCDYSDFAAPAAQAVAKGQCERGIVICTTGIGVSITANKVKGIRCALLSDLMSARLTRQHNDANMMALGAGVVGEESWPWRWWTSSSPPLRRRPPRPPGGQGHGFGGELTFPQISIYWTSRTSPRQRVMCPWEGFLGRNELEPAKIACQLQRTKKNPTSTE